MGAHIFRALSGLGTHKGCPYGFMQVNNGMDAGLMDDHAFRTLSGFGHPQGCPQKKDQLMW